MYVWRDRRRILTAGSYLPVFVPSVSKGDASQSSSTCGGLGSLSATAYPVMVTVTGLDVEPLGMTPSVRGSVTPPVVGSTFAQ